MVKIIEVISDEVEVLSVILKMMGPGGTGGSASFCVRTLATLLVLLLALQEAHAVIEERGEADVSARITPVFFPKENSTPLCFFPSYLCVLFWTVFVLCRNGVWAGVQSLR